MWDALFFHGDIFADYAAVRAKHRRLTSLRRRFFTQSELIYKARRSAFCIYGSLFRGTPELEEAAWIAALGCPVLVDAEFADRCPFGLPVDGRNRLREKDAFSDRPATMQVVEKALQIKRSEVRNSALEYLAHHRVQYLPVAPADPAIAEEPFWEADWDQAMVWNPFKFEPLP